MIAFFEKYIPFITLVISAISVAIIVLVTSKVQSLEIQFGVLTNEVNQYKNSLNHLYEVHNFHDEDQIEPAPIDQPYIDEIERMTPIVPQQPMQPHVQPVQSVPPVVEQQPMQPPVQSVQSVSPVVEQQQPMQPMQPPQTVVEQQQQQLNIPQVHELKPVSTMVQQQQPMTTTVNQ